jgi:DNA-binding NarL/FixJ family response regulator
MITSRLPGTVVVMLTVSRDDEDLFESLRRGAAGYLLKDMNPAKLSVAVRHALEGEASLPRELTSRVIQQFREGGEARRYVFEAPGRPELSKREREVFELLCEGAGTAQIARRLFLSPITVRRHVSTILGKLGVASREEAVQLAKLPMSPHAQDS